MRLIEASSVPAPLARRSDQRPIVRVGLVQHHWQADPAAMRGELADGIGQAVGAGAQVVFLPELTLSKYPAHVRAGARPKDSAEDLLGGPTFAFAAEHARRHRVVIHASLYEKPAPEDQPDDPRGYNTAILVSPDGELLGRTRKTHIPITSGYYEDTYFRPGSADGAYPVYSVATLGGARLGLPTCWDEWFPEVARAYGIGGAEVLAYPTAIGSEPDFPDFDTAPLWQKVIVANGISAGTFMVVPNRYGNEGSLNFYGTSFISDPFGRVLAQAPRDESVALVADLDLASRREWLELFPFYSTRRPDSYAILADENTLGRRPEWIDAGFAR